MAARADGDATGRRLVWLPYRPSAEDVARGPAARPSREIAPAQFQQPAETTPSSAMQDPFGDKREIPQSPTRMPTLPLAEPDTSRGAPAAPPLLVPRPSPPAEPAHQPPKTQGPSGPLPGFGAPAPPRTQSPPSISEEMGAKASLDPDECPPNNQFKSISELTHDIRPAAGELPRDCPMAHQPYTPRAWGATTFTWKASGLCHKPLYFEDVQLERYGHSWGPYLQPIISKGHFFLTVPALPYLMGVNPPNECMYTLGYYRPGSCAPYMLDPLPISVRGALWEAAAWTGGAFLVP
ncbi:MAG: hypothetical protein JW809_10180 [Pirellulales bacterium]|nr:hypothetical protein [Pirellulales bacterium]